MTIGPLGRIIVIAVCLFLYSVAITVLVGWFTLSTNPYGQAGEVQWISTWQRYEINYELIVAIGIILTNFVVVWWAVHGRD